MLNPVSLAFVRGSTLAAWGVSTLAVERWFQVGALYAVAPIMFLPLGVLAWQLWTGCIGSDALGQSARDRPTSADGIAEQSPERPRRMRRDRFRI